MRIAFQGERGAYSEEAIIQHFGASAQPIPKPYLRDVFVSVQEGNSDLGLVPVENTLEGSIVRTYDLLNEMTLKAQGEVVLKIVHCLIANPGVSHEDVREVYSHPQALGQCRAYLEEKGYEAVAFYDTAGSVKMLKEKRLRNSAAIASRRAAEVYGLVVLASGIETHPKNYTRFLLIGSEDHAPTSRDKTSIAFIVDHRPGTLSSALKAFAENGINLTKIESRPRVGKPWEYVFFIDVEGHRGDPIMRQALKELIGSSRSVKILGSYPQASTQLNPMF